MNLLKKLLNPSSEKLVTLTLSRGCFINGTHHAAGETLQVSSRIAGELVAAENAVRRDLDEAAEAERKRLANLIPGPVEPRPLPDSWSDLPSCFADLWHMEEAANCLVERRSKIWKVLIQTMKGYRALGDGMQNFNATYRQADFGMQEQLRRAFSNLHVGALPEQHLADVRALKEAFERIEAAVTDWNQANAAAWQVARFHASQHLLARHGKLCRSIRELHGLGREIFSERIKPLGLSEHKVGELFRGSADFVKYGSIEAPAVQDIRLAYADDSGPVYYLQKSPETMVWLLRRWEGIAEQVAKLTAQARKELTAARRVTTAA